jgi:hypothetical protein
MSSLPSSFWLEMVIPIAGDIEVYQEQGLQVVRGYYQHGFA